MAENAGAAFVYNAQTGALLRTLVASNGMAGDEFGANVAIDNGTHTPKALNIVAQGK